MRRFVFCLARLAFSLIFVVIAMPCVAFATNDIGKVIMFTPGATVLRDGKTEALALHAGIQVQDTLQTDAVGRVKVLFNDDSSVSLGPNTTMDMNEFADAGGKSAFSVNVPQGMIRAITGKIVDQNPDGFKMTSPEATVGIRGTIVTMHVHRGQGGRMRTTVYVENTLRRVYVNSENVPSGTKWIREGGASRQERISPEDRRHIGKELAFRGGSGSAAAAPEATEERRRSTDRFGDGKNALAMDDALKDDAKVAQTMLNLASQVAPMGRVSGSLDFGFWTKADFKFDVNLSSGAISNGSFDFSMGTPTDGLYGSLGGGVGSANSSGFSMKAVGTLTEVGTVPLNDYIGIYAATAIVSGSDNLRSIPSGSPLSGVSGSVDCDLVSSTGSITPTSSTSGISSSGTGTFTK